MFSDLKEPNKIPITTSNHAGNCADLFKPTKEKHKTSGPDGGLTVITAAVFVVGEMAGSGILAVPKAVVNCGWFGIVLVVIFCMNAGYGGSRLGLCWAIVEERYPEFRGQTRNPYSIIAYKAVGHWGSVLVSVCIQLTLFGAAIVFLLLSAEIMQDLLKDLIPQMGYCLWFLVFAAIITPPMWLGSPKDFWFIGVGAVIATTIACVLISVQITIDGSNNTEPVPHKAHSLQEFFVSFGTILFAYGGASTFPTIQNDMIHKDRFYLSIIIGFIVVLSLYMPVVMGGYFVYGDNVNTNVLLSLNRSLLVSYANVLIAIHLIMAFFIVINPVSQEIEEKLKIPQEFCVKRCMVRTVMVLLMVMFGETIPSFGKILSLVGGSTITLTTFVLPPLLYMKLCDQRNSAWPERSISHLERTYLWVMVIVGFVGGVCATYSAILDIVGVNSFTKPCYWPQ